MATARRAVAWKSASSLNDPEKDLYGDNQIDASFHEPDIADIVADKIQKEELLSAIERLPLKYKEVISRRYGIGAKIGTSDEIAHAIGMSPSSIPRLERKALELLRGIMDGESSV